MKWNCSLFYDHNNYSHYGIIFRSVTSELDLNIGGRAWDPNQMRDSIYIILSVLSLLHPLTSSWPLNVINILDFWSNKKCVYLQSTEFLWMNSCSNFHVQRTLLNRSLICNIFKIKISNLETSRQQIELYPFV